MGGNGAAWYVMDLTRVIKPVVFQKRRDYDFKALTDLNSERVFTIPKDLAAGDAVGLVDGLKLDHANDLLGMFKGGLHGR